MLWLPQQVYTYANQPNLVSHARNRTMETTKSVETEKLIKISFELCVSELLLFSQQFVWLWWLWQHGWSTRAHMCFFCYFMTTTTTTITVKRRARTHPHTRVSCKRVATASLLQHSWQLGISQLAWRLLPTKLWQLLRSSSYLISSVTFLKCN